MAARQRLILSILAVLAVFIVGTAGYMVIEVDQHPTFLDAAFMTTITLSTVGYGEAWELSPAGRLWSIGVITFGIATVSIAFTSLVTLFVGGELRSLRQSRKMRDTINKMSHHVIVCGFGRMGSLATREILQRGLFVAVIEADKRKLRHLREADTPFIIGNATDEDVLLEAGLMRADALVATLPHDADNVYVSLTAHTIHPELPIIARAEQPSAEEKLKRAGATRVVCSQVMGATHIANVLTRPNVVDFVDIANKGVDLEMDEYIVGTRSPLAGTTLRDSPLRQKTGAIVVAIKHADGKTHVNPDPDELLSVGDTLVLVGPAGVSSRLDSL
ncbi:MAG: potassium channel protein [Phycisphaerales bacterium]|nr:MAG: potassium channel protein [Phycisphaerales bacterium]